MGIIEYQTPETPRLSRLAMASLLAGTATIPGGFSFILVGRAFGGEPAGFVLFFELLAAWGPALTAVLCGAAALVGIRASYGGLRGKPLAWAGISLALTYTVLALWL